MKTEQEKSIDCIEKVQLTENLLLVYASGLNPKKKELKRARELGINVEKLKAVQDEDAAANY